MLLTAVSIKFPGSTVLIRVKLISIRHVIVVCFNEKYSEHKVKGGNEEMVGKRLMKP